MKKYLLLTLKLMLCVVIVCSCAPVPPVSPSQSGNQQEDLDSLFSPPSTVRLTMATGSTSGVYYPYGGVLALAISAATGYIKVNVNSTGASLENVQQIAGGLANLAIVQNDVVSYLNSENEAGTENTLAKLTTLMTLYPETCQLIVAADSDIESVADLKDKKISIGEEGSGVEVNALQILEAYGLTVDDIQVQRLGFGPSADAIRDNSVEGFFATSGLPNPAVVDLASARDLRVINLDAAKIDYLITNHPFYTAAVISERDYDFLSEPVNTVAVQAALIASADLDEQVAYDIVKAIIESKESIMVANAKGAFIDPEYAVAGLSINLHPGARKYFQEIGVL